MSVSLLVPVTRKGDPSNVRPNPEGERLTNEVGFGKVPVPVIIEEAM